MVWADAVLWCQPRNCHKDWLISRAASDALLIRPVCSRNVPDRLEQTPPASASKYMLGVERLLCDPPNFRLGSIPAPHPASLTL